MSQDLHIPEQIGCYKLRGTIGSGAFSTVKLAYHIEKGEYYACKIIPKEKLNTPKRMQRFELEIRIQQQLKHPGIVKIFELFRDEYNLYVIMEFCSSGELFQFIVDKSQLPEEEARPIMDQILTALKYIHGARVAHRDLKPENILIDSTGRIKISDFGLSRFLPAGSNLVSTPCGSPCYASPECLTGLPYNGRISDIWSVGVILYAMVVGQLPWTKRNQNELFKQIKAAEFTIPDHVSEECQDLIRKFLTPDTNRRITIDEALKHPWFDPMIPPALVDLKVTIPDLSLRRIDSFFDTDAAISEDVSCPPRRTLSFAKDNPVWLTHLLKTTKVKHSSIRRRDQIPSPRPMIDSLRSRGHGDTVRPIVQRNHAGSVRRSVHQTPLARRVPQTPKRSPGQPLQGQRLVRRPNVTGSMPNVDFV